MGSYFLLPKTFGAWELMLVIHAFTHLYLSFNRELFKLPNMECFAQNGNIDKTHVWLLKITIFEHNKKCAYSIKEKYI